MPGLQLGKKEIRVGDEAHGRFARLVEAEIFVGGLRRLRGPFRGTGQPRGAPDLRRAPGQAQGLARLGGRVLPQHGQRAVEEVAQPVGQAGVDRVLESALAEITVRSKCDLAHEEEAHRVGAVGPNQCLRVEHVAE